MSLILYFNNVTETGAQNIADSLIKLTQLKKLTLDLSFNYILNEGAAAISKALDQLKNLQTLSLNFNSKNFGPLGFKYIALSVAKLTQLTELEL